MNNESNMKKDTLTDENLSPSRNDAKNIVKSLYEKEKEKALSLNDEKRHKAINKKLIIPIIFGFGVATSLVWPRFNDTGVLGGIDIAVFFGVTLTIVLISMNILDLSTPIIHLHPSTISVSLSMEEATAINQVSPRANIPTNDPERMKIEYLRLKEIAQRL